MQIVENKIQQHASDGWRQTSNRAVILRGMGRPRGGAEQESPGRSRDFHAVIGTWRVALNRDLHGRSRLIGSLWPRMGVSTCPHCPFAG